MENPKISIVIRVRNEARDLDLVLKSLSFQKEKNFEIIIVDNESTDGSADVARRYNAKVIDIPTKGWSYGKALNLGISQASADIILILSAHSVPIGQYFLHSVLDAFEDEKVGAVRLIHSQKGFDLERWCDDSRIVSSDNWELINSEGPLASGCGILKQAWEKVAFDETLESVEDKYWAKGIIENGYHVIRCGAVYYYSKKRSLIDNARVRYNYSLAYYRITGKYRMSILSFLHVVFIQTLSMVFFHICKNSLNYFYMKKIYFLSKIGKIKRLDQ